MGYVPADFGKYLPYSSVDKIQFLKRDLWLGIIRVQGTVLPSAWRPSWLHPSPLFNDLCYRCHSLILTRDFPVSSQVLRK